MVAKALIEPLPDINLDGLCITVASACNLPEAIFLALENSRIHSIFIPMSLSV
jgi:hypothetical protein